MIETALFVLLAAQAHPPVPELGPVVEAARKAFEEHDFSRLFRGPRPVRLRLPSQRAGVPVSGRVAAASLSAFVRRFEERAMTVLGTAVLTERLGYVELERRFSLVGVAEEQSQRVLLSVRLEEGGWRVAELWVLSP